MQLKSFLLVAGVLAVTAWAKPASAQERSAAYRVFDRPGGALLIKETGYDSGSIVQYSFECAKRRTSVAFRYFEDPDNQGPDFEGVDYESLMSFSVTGLKHRRGCDQYCRNLMARLHDRGANPVGFLHGQISWKEFRKGTQRDIAEEPRPPVWHGYTEFARTAKQRIAYFKQRCGVK